jgi:triosephosphate isomerase (TIM)
MRQWMVAGNWKMHNTRAEAVALAERVKEGAGGAGNVEVVLAPPYPLLDGVGETIRGSRILLAAQNMFYEDRGAYTGEVSPGMLLDLGCTYVILGHSERRKYFHETDEDVNHKAKKSLTVGLKPIVCVGETEEEREKGVTEFVVGIQIKKALNGIERVDDVVVAYEPVWAIGTGKNATPIEAEEVHRFLRSVVGEMYGDVCNGMRILYGGSVTPENIGVLMEMKDIDGALVGGASLKGDVFNSIIKTVAEKR